MTSNTTINMKKYYVYLLTSSNNATYIGATINLERRLRQHNKEITGGAQSTGYKVSKGETWTRALHIEGFPDWNAALQFEWRFKQLSRKLPQKMYPLERRIKALKMLLELERPTNKAIPYSQWNNKPNVVVENDETQLIYNKYFTT